MTQHRPFAPLLLFALALGLGAPAAAQAVDPVEQHNSSALWFENWIGLSNATLTIAEPNGTVSQVFAASGTPVFQLSGAPVQDGVYRYELRAATDARRAVANPQASGRESPPPVDEPVPYYTTGSFTVERGVIVRPADVIEEQPG
ncbi:hypothetical protein [Roseivivax marinus]|uniref:hypothetical protein n=1 Tax=Roseivivax marinus TaxID=1379903 RepID=UPI00273ED69E|nr:hypothetical protein [Roseivivax marinus]